MKHGVLCIHGLKNDCSYVFSDLAWRVFYCISNDCEKDAVVVGLVNSATSLYASVSVFSILGFKAKNNYVSCLQRYALPTVVALAQPYGLI